MREWIGQNSLEKAFSIYMDGQKGWNPKTEDWKNHLNISGAQWYRYTDLRVDLQNGSNSSNSSSINEAIPSESITIPGQIDSQIMIPKTQTGTATLKLLDHTGNLLLQNINEKDDSVKLNLKKITPGIYFLSFLQENIKRHYRIVVQR